MWKKGETDENKKKERKKDSLIGKKEKLEEHEERAEVKHVGKEMGDDKTWQKNRENGEITSPDPWPMPQ